MPMPESVPRKLPSCCLVSFAIVVMMVSLSVHESAQCGLDANRPHTARRGISGLGLAELYGKQENFTWEIFSVFPARRLNPLATRTAVWFAIIEAAIGDADSCKCPKGKGSGRPRL